ncbi:pseudouridine synthase [Rheinheimera salexigens]|uniref:Pseudouridine synthase n=1 Tax=Rheinheimera salexigens TaxID=1628148 RepID=A0A1E7Q4M8_9GAMM|nr:pseudouridine synthase [Rheinheimera salexigens]OEY69154.1 pseudouridine synthase [Rheinheimera salexigens]
MSIAAQASKVSLPADAAGFGTVFEFLCAKFPYIAPQVWQQRIADGKVYWHQGECITEQTPFMPSKLLCYYREVEIEPEVPFSHQILYQDQHLIVADKPHFLPVTPGGQYVNECLLARLKRQTGLTDIVPLHRLDRDTAGLVLFSINPQSRAAYYALFSGQTISKQYQAVAMLSAAVKQQLETETLPLEWQIKNRIEKANPRFINHIVAGEANSESEISLTKVQGDKGLFTLMPLTGKTHQLRLHMLSLGMPILHDIYYPELQPKQPPQFATPLQLLAKELQFIDPVSGIKHSFASQLQLTAW